MHSQVKRTILAGKYDPLHYFLRKFPGTEWSARYQEIEKVLGFDLPRSARQYSAWWSNERQGSHTHARSWLDAGFKTSHVNITAESVLFSK